MVKSASLSQDVRYRLLLGVAFLLMLIGAYLHLSSGVMNLQWYKLFGGWSEVESIVFWELRFPRVLLVMIVGSGLAVSGVVLQALFRNPLAEPGLIGVSSSAALGAVFVIVLGGVLWGQVSAWQMGMAALLAALLATAFIYRIASRHGQTDVAMMLLAGVAINAIAGATTQLLITVSDDAQLRTVMFWMMGSFANGNPEFIWVLGVLTLAVSLLLWRLARPLNAFLLGESNCLHMGFAPKAVKWRIIWGSALIVGLAVATVGVIGFVGLIIPHIARLLIGSDHRRLIPMSALLGAVLLLYADWFAKTVIQPAELPIGLFMALLGGPFFLMMLIRQRRRWGV